MKKNYQKKIKGSNHKTKIETGRYYQNKKGYGTLCPICESNKIEGESR